MSLDTVTLDDALRLLSLPRVVGRRPGRRRGDHRAERPLRAVPEEGHRLALARVRGAAASTITLDEALAIYAQPKQRGRAGPPRRRCASSAPTRSRGQPIVVKEGRFGAYVTDGETNATLRKGDAVETVTIERAAELLAEKRAKGPAPKKRAAPRKAPARKAATGSRRRS